MRIRSLTFGAAIAAMLALTIGPTAVAATDPATCSDGHWPGTVSGLPTLFEPGAAGGDYVWHDADGWHVRVTHRGDDRRVFTGRIDASAPLDSAPVALEHADELSLSVDRKTIRFRFTNYGHVDGFDFRASCARRLTFRFEIAGARTPVARIWLGHRNLHPLQNPFVITRIG